MAGFFQSLNIIDSRPPQSLIPQCGKCGLYKKCQSPKMPVSGEGRKRILVVGEAPGREEDEQGKPFVGQAGRFLERCLDHVGIDLRKDCWITNALICRPPDNKIEDRRSVEYCRPNLIRTVEELKPETVLLLGTQAVRSLIGWVWKEDVGPISRWVGWQIPIQRIRSWVCPTWHPSYLVRLGVRGATDEMPIAQLFIKHLRGVVQAGKREWTDAPIIKVRTILDSNDAAEWVYEFRNRGRAFAFDFETDRLKPDEKSSSIISCALSDGNKTVAFPWGREVRKEMRSLLKSDVPKIGYNLKFEDRWVRKEYGFGVNNWIHDGMLAAHVLDNRQGTKSLKFQSFVRLGTDEYSEWTKKYMKSGGSNEANTLRDAPIVSLLKYNGMDAALEYHIAQIQMKQIGSAQ